MTRDKQLFREAAARLKERRQAVGLSTRDMAGRLGVDLPRYRSWEKVFGPLPQHRYGEAIDRIVTDELERVLRAACAQSSAQAPSPAVAALPSEQTRVSLGERAKARRRYLRLGASAVAAELGVSPMTLRGWEVRLPREHRAAAEDAWEDALRVPRGWLRDPTATAPDLSAPPALDLTALDLTAAEPRSLAVEIHEVGHWLARTGWAHRGDAAQFSRKALQYAAMFADRYGVSGHGGSTLQAIGNKFGVTRERVRQILEKMIRLAGDAKITLPALSRLRSALSESAVRTVADFEAEHAELLGGVTLGDAGRFAQEIAGSGLALAGGRKFGATGSALPPLILDPALEGLAVTVRSAARRMIRSCGAAHILFVTGMASADLGRAVAVGDVASVLEALDGMEWLSTDREWFWFGADAASNRALDATRKVLAAAGRRVDVDDLHQALGRSRRAFYRGTSRPEATAPPEIEIPLEALRDLLSRVPWLTVVQKNDFVLAAEVKEEDVLSSSELAVVRAIREHGGALPRHVLLRQFVGTGVFSLPSLHQVLAHSPVIRQLRRGVYAVRGVEVTPSAYSRAVQSAFANGDPTQDRGPSADGQYEFELSLSEYAVRNMVASIPMWVAGALPRGVYEAEGLVAGSFVIGTTRTAPGRVRGLVAMLRRAGVGAGERLHIEIHPESRKARIVRVSESASEKKPSPTSARGALAAATLPLPFPGTPG